MVYVVYMTITKFLKQNHTTQSKLAEHLGISRSSISLKLRGIRPINKTEINSILAFCRDLDPSVTYEKLFNPTGSES